MSKPSNGMGRYADYLLGACGRPLAGVPVTVETMEGDLAPIYDRKGRRMANPLMTKRRSGRRRKPGYFEFRATPARYLLRMDDGMAVLVVDLSEVPL